MLPKCCDNCDAPKYQVEQTVLVEETNADAIILEVPIKQGTVFHYYKYLIEVRDMGGLFHVKKRESQLMKLYNVPSRK